MRPKSTFFLKFVTYNAFFFKLRQKLTETSFKAYFEGVPVNHVALFTLSTEPTEYS